MDEVKGTGTDQRQEPAEPSQESPQGQSRPESDVATASTPASLLIRQALKEVAEPFANLSRAPRSLWGINLTNLLEGLVYFGILTVLGKYLSENVGLSDLHAGWVMSFMTGGITLAMLFLGGVADRIGVRKALLVSLMFLVGGRALMALSSQMPGGGAFSPMFVTLMLGIVVVVAGYGMFQPASYMGVKQFTDERTKAMGFAMLYGLMNLGSFISGVLSPPVRKSAGIGGLFGLYTIITLAAAAALFFILTKRSVARDTLTSVEGDSMVRQQGRLVSKKAVSLRLLVIGQLAVLAFIGLIVVGLLKPDEPVRTAAHGVNEVLTESAHVVDGSISTGDIPRVEMLRRASAVLLEFSTSVTPGREADGAYVVSGVFDLVRARLAVESDLLLATSKTPRDMERPLVFKAPEVRDFALEVRHAGIVIMAAAYRLVGSVDESVVGSLERRFGRPEDSLTFELPLEERQSLLRWMGEPVPQMLMAIASRCDKLGDSMVRRWDDRAALVRRTLMADAMFFRQAAGLLDASASAELNAAVSQRLVEAAVFYLNVVPDVLGTTLKLGDGAPTPTGSALLHARMLHVASTADAWADDAVDAVSYDRLQGLLNWLLRYGILLAALLVFGGLALRMVLKQKPDHPFNDGPFVFFIFILIPVQTLFAHNWLTLPYYIDRAFAGGFVGSNFELFANINPILIFVLSPIVAAFTFKKDVYRMLIAGTAIMAAPTFLLALGPNPLLLVVYILVMSVGEAMWQPRFLQWVAEIAPKGRTGLYMGIAQFPWFVTKVITGAYSGYFLARYCPMVGPQNTEVMWLIYGGIAMVTPTALLLLAKWARRGSMR